MKMLVTSVSTLLFVGSVCAATDAEIYHGFAMGNPDLSTETSTSAAGQAGIGSDSGNYRTVGATSNDIYHGFEMDNADLWSGFSDSRNASASVPGIGTQSGRTRRHAFTDNDIYHGFERNNPDL